MKSLLLRALVIAALLIPIAGAATREAQAGYNLCGDPTNDGVVNSLDALLILQVNAGLTMLPLPATDAADVDNNGTVGARDASLILQYSAGLLDSLDTCFDKPLGGRS